MGGLYGQSSRLLLNHDAVFLSELLADLSADSRPLEAHDAAYASYNCFALPASPERMPLPLQIAASATLLMTEFKLADQIDDGAKGRWRLAQKLYSPGFYAAAERLQALGFPVAALREWYQAQAGRETAARAGQAGGSPREILAYVAGPTAAVTGLVFQRGAEAVGSDSETQRAMGEFGELIYTLDACDDAEKDAQNGEFNALRAAFGLKSATDALPSEIHKHSAAILQAMGTRVTQSLYALPLPEGRAALFAARLNRNLARRMVQTASAAYASHVHAPAPEASFRERWDAAMIIAHRISAPSNAAPSALSARLAKPFRFAAALGVALVFPLQAQTANSLRECRDITLNLIFIGEAVNGMARRFAFAAASPTGANLVRTMSQELTPPEADPEKQQEVVVTKPRRAAWGSGARGDTTWCDSCDCAACACGSACDCCAAESCGGCC